MLLFYRNHKPQSVSTPERVHGTYVRTYSEKEPLAYNNRIAGLSHHHFAKCTGQAVLVKVIVECQTAYSRSDVVPYFEFRTQRTHLFAIDLDKSVLAKCQTWVEVTMHRKQHL
jgi:hypothetical protein